MREREGIVGRDYCDRRVGFVISVGVKGTLLQRGSCGYFVS